jgi:hypothetical protein
MLIVTMTTTNFRGVKTGSAGRKACENPIKRLLPDFLRTEFVVYELHRDILMSSPPDLILSCGL